MTRKKLLIGLAIIVALAAIAYVNVVRRRTSSISVTVEKVMRRDLEAVVSASGKVQPKRQVNISAETMGKVVNLAVAEGDEVKTGQLLLQIDPRNLESAVQNREASLASARSTLEQTRAQVENAKVSVRQAEDTYKRQENMWNAGLLARDQYERAQNDLKMRQTDLVVSEQSVRTQEQRIRQEEANLESAKYDLNKVRIVSPISGLVTRRNIQEGETVVTGTMNNAGTVLLTIADMSVIDTEIEVDETDIPFVRIGQPAKVTIDAIPDRTFDGKVTEVGNSPIQATGTATAATGRATNFKVVVTLNGQVPNVRPGFTCTAVITTATKQSALGVPIQAMTVREFVVDAEGAIVKTPPPPGATATPVSAPAELKAGQTRKEFEGVFVVADGRAAFEPVKTGIAGEKYFEILEGLKEGDEVITGPFASVRSLKEGDAVKIGPGIGFTGHARDLMHQFYEAATIAVQAIWANKLRSLLTVIGNIVAVTSIIAVVSLIQGLNAAVEDAIQSEFAADAFSIQRRGITQTDEENQRAESNPRVSFDDAQAIREFSSSIGMVMAEITSSAQVKYRGMSLDSVSTRGVTKEFNTLPSTSIERGRVITPTEFDSGRPVAVLGWGTADRLFGPLDPVDKTITIAGVHFRVVGVAPQKGSILGQSQDEWIVVPILALQRIFGTRQSLELTVRPTNPALLPTAMDDARVALRVSRRLRARDPDNFGLLTSTTFLSLYSQATSGIFAVLIGVVSLSLVVGGIVIMNIMLMVVSERTREIGLRKSLGARRRDVLWQILTESITLSTFGGLCGTILGFVVAWIISKVSPLPAIVEPWSVGLGISMTAIVGLFFGLYPAMRAASLDPIEALRRE